VSGEAPAGAPDAAGSATAASATPPAAQPLTEAAPGRSAPGGGATPDSGQPEAAAGREVTDEELVAAVGEVVSAKTEVVANGLLDGLKIVAQNGEAKDRAERLSAGQAPVVFDTADSPACTDCGSIMVRNGSCYKCINCGATSGCS